MNNEHACEMRHEHACGSTRWVTKQCADEGNMERNPARPRDDQTVAGLRVRPMGRKRDFERMFEGGEIIGGPLKRADGVMEG